MQPSADKRLVYSYFDYISTHMAQFAEHVFDVESGDIKSIDIYLSKYAEMSEPMRHLVICDLLIGQVENGGFYQYYFNSDGATAPEAVVGFRATGEEELARIVEESLKFFTEGMPREQAARRAQLLEGETPAQGVSNRARALFEPLDSRFYEIVGMSHEIYMQRIIARYPKLLP